MIVAKRKPSWLIPSVCTLAAISLLLYLLPGFAHYQKFYHIFFRFWELAAGGILALAFGSRLLKLRFSWIAIVALIVVLCVDFTWMPDSVGLIAVILLTCGVLAVSNTSDGIARFLLGNKLMVGIGKISFSLYMWHQVLLAYARYFWAQELKDGHLLVLFLMTFALSVASYYLIEQPFRDYRRVGVKALLWSVGSVFLLTSSVSLFIYFKGGVLRDIPELGIEKGVAGRRIHAAYNERGYAYDRPFGNSGGIRVLVIGNSFARDWVNVLLESKFSAGLDISYIAEPGIHRDLVSRMDAADVIFYSAPSPREVKRLAVPESKLWAVGTKNFGVSNGLFYNHAKEGYFTQRTPLEKGIMEYNNLLKTQWGERYIDLIALVADEHDQVPVFTPTRLFISQDCRHFTKGGATYFSQLLEDKLGRIFGTLEKSRS